MKMTTNKSNETHRQGEILQVPFSAAKQYINSGFAEVYFEAEEV